MSIRLILAACATLVAATAAHAADEKPSSDEVAKARARAERMIVSANASDVFEYVAADDIPTVRHRASGMICGFGDAPSDHLAIAQSGLPRGDDVACYARIEDFRIERFATRKAVGMTLDQASASCERRVRANHQDARPLAGDGMLGTTFHAATGYPDVRTYRFEFRDRGKPQVTQCSVVIVRDWVIEVDVSGPGDDAQSVDLFSGVDVLAILGAILDPSGPAETGTKP